MRAARYYGKEDIRIEAVDEQKCGAGQVRVCRFSTARSTIHLNTM
jgi:hypothetical protein